MKYKSIPYLLLILSLCFVSNSAEAKKKRRRRYMGPPLTHPVVLWGKTLSESSDREQRKVAAFKLSQYSQTIYQQEVIDTLIRCMKDSDVQIKVLCTKAMGRAGFSSHQENIRNVLLERFHQDASLRSTIVRTFTVRKDSSPKVHDTFLENAKTANEPDELLPLLNYLEGFGSGSDRFVEILSDIYRRIENTKIRRAAVKALAEKAQGQDTVIALLSQCVESKDTPLVLTCLSGLQAQARRDGRAWEAAVKTVASDDPDVLLATLDLINSLPERKQPVIAARLVSLIGELDDIELEEKAILAIGVCGDQSEPIVQALLELFEGKNTEESIRIAAALVLGKQAAFSPEKPRATLHTCETEAKSQALRTACQLGLKDLETNVKVAASVKPVVDRQPTEASPAPIVAPKQ